MTTENSSKESLKNLLAKPNTGSTTDTSRPDKSTLGTTFFNLIDVMDIAMWELDMNYRVVGYNRKAEQIYGKDAIGDYCYYIAAKRDTVCDVCPARMIYDGQDSGRSQHERVDVSGKKIFIDHIATPIRDSDGNLTGVLVLIIDITRQKLLEEEIRQHRNKLEEMVSERTQELTKSQERYRTLYKQSTRSEALYRSLFNSSADAVVIYDLEGKVQLLSPSFSEIFGWTIGELEGKRIPFVPEPEKEATMVEIHRVIETGGPSRNFPTRRFTKDGRLLDIYISASKFDDHVGNPAGMLVILRDITQTKEMERQLHHAHRMEAIGTLAGGIAHDFNNLLMGIQGNASLLRHELVDADEHQEKLGKITQYVRRGSDLTKQLLGLAKGGKYEVIVTDINALLHSSSEMFGRTKKEVSIHRNYQKGVWPVEVDRGQIEQVLLNIFVNAWQAMPTGGDLFIETQNMTLDERKARQHNLSSGRYVVISIADTGKGIDKVIQDRIFDPFFTTKEKERGTGLGLASAYGIISNHNGIIFLESELGKGSTFYIYLPASAKPIETETVHADHSVGGNETILLVDDEEMVVDVGIQMLEMLGYKVICAFSGKQAVEIYQKEDHDIDMVILDMVMPGLGGSETFNQLKTINPNIKVLLSSGYSLNGLAAEIMRQGCSGFLQKPFDLNDISRKVRQIIETGKE